MEILLVFAACLIIMDCLTGVTGGVCPGYNIPVIWPCSDGTITGTKLLMDASDIPIDMLQCNCKITTSTNAIQISLLKAPGYRNCGTEIRFSTAESTASFDCIEGGTIVSTTAIKTVDVLVDKDNTIADTRHCLYIDVTPTPTNSIANMSITCSSHRSTVAPTTNIPTALPSTVSPSPPTTSTVVSTSSYASTAISTSPSPSATSTVTSTSSSAASTASSTVITSPTHLATIPTIQTSTGSTAKPTSTSFSPITNPITTTTRTSPENKSPSTQRSSTADSKQNVTSKQETMAGSTPGTTDQGTEITTTVKNQEDTTSSKGVTMETSSMSITNTGAIDISDSTVSGKTDSESTDGSEASPNTEQSTTSYTGTTPNNATLTDDDKEANPERLTVVIVIATIIGIILICVLVGAIYYQKKQKRKASLNHRRGFTNMASTVDTEKATKEDSNNHVYDNPNLIPYGHMGNT